MKKKVLALVLGMSLLMTFMPVHSEESDNGPVQEELQEASKSETTSEATAVPTIAPTPAPTEVPTPPSADEPTEAPAETPTPVPTQEPTEKPAQEPTEEPFTAKVRIELENKGQIYFGDRVSLRAVVENANAAFVVAWQYYNTEADVEHGEDPWVEISKGDTFSFNINESSAALTYRAVVNGKIASDPYSLPAVQERPTQEPDEDPSIADALNPDRWIEIQMRYDGELAFGSQATFVAVLHGYDGLDCDLQWETSADNENWEAVPGADGLEYTMTVTEENYLNYWRVCVEVIGMLAQ